MKFPLEHRPLYVPEHGAQLVDAVLPLDVSGNVAAPPAQEPTDKSAMAKHCPVSAPQYILVPPKPFGLEKNPLQQ